MLIETERMTVRDFGPDDVNDLHEILGGVLHCQKRSVSRRPQRQQKNDRIHFI